MDTRDAGKAAGDVPSDCFVAPLALPGAPARYYFLFGAPIETAGVADEPEAVAALYARVRQSLRDGMDFLLSQRQTDPFADLGTRMVYEAAAGRAAPTFPL